MNAAKWEAAPAFDRWFWLAMLIAALVVIPRCMLISRADSETVDEPAHIDRGLTFVYRNRAHKSIEMNDPPFGDVLIVLPMLAMGANPADPIVWSHWPGGKSANLPRLSPSLARRLRIMRQEILYGYAASPEALLLGISIWKAILFIPFAGLVFHIGRRLYGLHAGYLVLAMLLIDPTFAAHTGLATLDVLGVEAIVLACYVGWRYFENPGRKRLIAMALSTALAFAIKFTAMAVPVILLAYALAFWVKRRVDGAPNIGVSQNSRDATHRGILAVRSTAAIRQIANNFALFLLIFLFALYASTLFDFSSPRNWMWPLAYPPGGGFQILRDFFDPLLDLRWPGGIYVGAFLGGMVHAHRGHWGFLWGQNKSPGGWWYYFPVVATYKIPIGFFVIFLLAAISFIWVRPRFRELLALIPAILFAIMLCASDIDIGFRHFLPALIFIYILAARCFAPPLNKMMAMIVLGWLGAIAAFAHTLTYFPDLIPYINYPRTDAWRDIGDSNIDWGQTVKQVRIWLDAHPSSQPVYLVNFIDDTPARYYLDHRVVITHAAWGIPKSGTLIISPNCVDSIFDWYDSYAALRTQKPIATIGHAMLVYDLDRLHATTQAR